VRLDASPTRTNRSVIAPFGEERAPSSAATLWVEPPPKIGELKVRRPVPEETTILAPPRGEPVKPGLLRPYYPVLAASWRLLDGVWIVVVYLLAAAVLGAEWPPPRWIAATAPAVLLFWLVGEGTGLYRTWRGAPLKREVARVWLSWALVVPVLLLAAFLTKRSADYSRAVVTGWIVGTPLLVSLWRGVVRYALEELRRRGRNTRAVALVGSTRMSQDLLGQIADNPWLGLRVHGVYDDRSSSRLRRPAADATPLRGTLHDLVRDAQAGKIDLAYITLPLRAEKRIGEIVRRLADSTCSVYVVPDLHVSSLLRARWSAVGELPVVSVFETPFYGVSGWLKRVEDIVIGTAILALIAIPMAVVAIAVKATSKGPVFFHQRRYGLNGQPIDILKFRTMTVCEDGPVVQQATKDDPRFTPIGAFLRRTSLDELPQFLHVLTGKMSIVGPRPHAVAHNELYRSRIPGYMLRHKVKPGITGWAQVNGWRGETDTLEKMQRRVEHDLAYISNWALLLDLKIILRTVFGRAVWRNAY